MARLTILIAFLAALVLVVHTNASFLSKQICDKQIQQINLKHCEKHIMHRIQQQQQQQQGQGEEEEGEEEENVLKLRGIRRNWGTSGSSRQQQILEKCCNQLSELDNPRCQCRALQQIFENQSEMLQGRQQTKIMEQQLKNLPQTCGLGSIRKCDVNPEEQD
ncbi:hypothetical protein RIF29_05542 [Crotalaria pallida]|uniref:Bifunctional inhibitor/plant lipid transfer protein/seed storage helical domain-containing protein n=1 Tax=Crotalaria pallida TaxID=3830 RepID=A0AAN9P9T5_CROPI